MQTAIFVLTLLTALAGIAALGFAKRTVRQATDAAIKAREAHEDDIRQRRATLEVEARASDRQFARQLALERVRLLDKAAEILLEVITSARHEMSAPPQEVGSGVTASSMVETMLRLYVTVWAVTNLGGFRTATKTTKSPTQQFVFAYFADYSKGSPMSSDVVFSGAMSALTNIGAEVMALAVADEEKKWMDRWWADAEAAGLVPLPLNIRKNDEERPASP